MEQTQKSRTVRDARMSPKRTRDGEIMLPGPKSRQRNNLKEANQANEKE